jgi:flagellar motility protein MotE (MotC chaperone)
MTPKPNLVLLLAFIAAACGGEARAGLEQAEAPPAAAVAPAAAGESSGDEGVEPLEVDDDDALEDAEADSAAPTVDHELAAAKELVDAAIARASDRGELERLAIAQQRNELDQASAEVQARLTAIDTLEARVDEILGAGKVEREHRRERVDMLANLVATMSPTAAATMLAQMSDAQAQDLLFAVAQSDKRKAAKLIATMPAERAAAIGQRYLTKDPEAIGDLVPPVAETSPTKDMPKPPPAEPAAPPTDPEAPPSEGP